MRNLRHVSSGALPVLPAHPIRESAPVPVRYVNWTSKRKHGVSPTGSHSSLKMSRNNSLPLSMTAVPAAPVDLLPHTTLDSDPDGRELLHDHLWQICEPKALD